MQISYKDLPQLRSSSPDKKIAFLAGTFDLFHVGHLAYLTKAKQFGDILVVGINSNSRTRRVKGPNRPVISQGHRAQVVGGLGVVDYSFVMPASYVKNMRPTFQVIQKLKPNVFIVADKGWYGSLDFYKQYGTELELLPRVSRTSTSRIIKKISSGCENNKP